MTNMTTLYLYFGVQCSYIFVHYRHCKFVSLICSLIPWCLTSPYDTVDTKPWRKTWRHSYFYYLHLQHCTTSTPNSKQHYVQYSLYISQKRGHTARGAYCDAWLGGNLSRKYWTSESWQSVVSNGQIADNTHDDSVEDLLYALATPRKKRFPVQRLPTSTKNTPKRFIPPRASKASDSQDVSPLSEPEISLPSLPSISRLCFGSQENLLDLSMGEISPTPTKVRTRMPESESMSIEDILQCGTLDNAGLLGKAILNQ